MGGPLVIVVLLVALWALFVRGNPGGLSDAKYAAFKQLAPPKLLYSCTRKPSPEWLVQQTRECAQSGRAGCEEKVNESVEAATVTVVEFVGGRTASSYDELLRRARQDCGQGTGHLGSGKLVVLEAVKD